MEPHIFEQKLSVAATSLYLLLASFADQGRSMDRQQVSAVWNASESELDQAYTELVSRHIAGADSQGHWFLRPVSSWHPPPG